MRNRRPGGLLAEPVPRTGIAESPAVAVDSCDLAPIEDARRNRSGTGDHDQAVG